MQVAAILQAGTEKLVTATETTVINFYFYTDYRHLKLQYSTGSSSCVLLSRFFFFAR